MTTQPDHTDVGAYALGLLDEAEMTLFEEHLLTCERCGDELDELISLPPLLQPLVSVADAGAEASPAVTAVHESPSLEAVSEPKAVAAEPEASTSVAVSEPTPDHSVEAATPRSRRRYRRIFELAAAVALIVAGPIVGIAIGHHETTKPTTDSVAAMLMMVGEQHKATDPATGISATVGLEQRSWGTHVAIQLSGIHGPLTCDLVAVSKTGKTQVITNWLVPVPGYGVPGNEQPLVLHGGAAMAKTDIDHFEVRTDDGKTLISVPM